MPNSKTKGNRRSSSKPVTKAASTNGEVLTLAETAAYLRITEDEVERLIREQGLPGRKLLDDWRFFKVALQDWLRGVPSKKEGLLMQIGAFSDDANLEEMLEQIHKQRGRRDTEED